MNAALPPRLAAPVLFVVGKGGTGKSTAAAALALHWAESGQCTHLISTDPAHSLADVLEQPAWSGASSVASLCSHRLQIEEFDAADFASRWLAGQRASLIDLVERGTYLDAQDAEQFLDLSLPGVDEVMAALRLVQLAAGGTPRIVVDCAPTGHLLRLTEAGSLLSSWAAALEAMKEKAAAVAMALVGRAPESGHVVTELRAQSLAFEALLGAADFLVITRGEGPVEAETGRLIATLREKNFRVAAVLANDTPSFSADWFAPRQPAPPVGCSRLRVWLDSVGPNEELGTGPSPSPITVRHIASKILLDRELRQKLLLVSGKGGVGKSTVAGALALGLDGANCLISTDPAGSLSEVWDQPVGDSPVEVSPGIRARQLAAGQEFERLRSSYADQVESVFQRVGLDRSVVLDRAVIDRLLSLAPPGLDEVIALGALLQADDQCERTILDSAPTGHFLRLIELPGLALNWTHALLRVLLRYRLAGPLEDFTNQSLTFARRTRALAARLQAPDQTGAILVTLDEPVVWSETERLHQALTSARIPVAALIINRAGDGPIGGHPVQSRFTRVIRVPLCDVPPQGPVALRAFLSQWEVLS